MLSTSTTKNSGVPKIYILDTNVLLYDPQAIFSFQDNHVIVPIVVIDEIDSKKSDPKLGYNARETIRIIDSFRAQGHLISDGVDLPEGGTFRIEINNDKNIRESPLGRLDLSNPDNRILLVAYNLSEKEKKDLADNPKSVVIVSNDGAVRIKAEAVGLRAEEYKTNMIKYDTLYTGLGEIQTIPDNVMDQLLLSHVADYDIDDSFPNQFFNVKTEKGSSEVTARYLQGKIHAINNGLTAGKAFDLIARNSGQNCAIDLLMNEQIGMISLVGPAGTGKTLLAIAAGLDKVTSGHCSSLVITRPTKSVGDDMGYLPGDISSKMEPWMRPVFDSIDFLMMNNSSKKGRLYRSIDSTPAAKMIEDGVLEIQPLAYARGITLPNVTLIVDEAQNLTPHEVKTLATRIGEGSRVIFTGDPEQIDNPYVNKNTNGLTYFVDRIKGQIDYGHVTLTEGERSRIATICSKLL